LQRFNFEGAQQFSLFVKTMEEIAELEDMAFASNFIPSDRLHNIMMI
jgi:hypothetical protein